MNQDENKIYEGLIAAKELLEADMQTINNIYSKVTLSHDYKELAKRTNQLRERVESRVKELKAKILQWDMHFKSQAEYQEMLKNEQTINQLCEKYL